MAEQPTPCAVARHWITVVIVLSAILGSIASCVEPGVSVVRTTVNGAVNGFDIVPGPTAMDFFPDTIYVVDKDLSWWDFDNYLHASKSSSITSYFAAHNVTVLQTVDVSKIPIVANNKHVVLNGVSMSRIRTGDIYVILLVQHDLMTAKKL